MVGDDGRRTKDFNYSDRGVLGRHAADSDGVAVRGQSDVFDGRVPAFREWAVVAFGTGVVVVVLLHILGREHAGDGPAWRRRHTIDIWPRRGECGGIERGGRRRAGLHVRDVVLERERENVDGMVARESHRRMRWAMRGAMRWAMRCLLLAEWQSTPSGVQCGIVSVTRSGKGRKVERVQSSG